MKYINDESYEYIKSKYVTGSRFVRKDDIFSPNSGMAPDKILSGIMENDQKIEHLSHPERKARALEFVLKNTRISCDRRDIFPAINMIDRPLTKTVIGKWDTEVFKETIPDVWNFRTRLCEDGIVTIWQDYDHSVPVWDRLFELGFSGILAESERIRAEKPRDEKENAFFDTPSFFYSLGFNPIFAAFSNIKANAASCSFGITPSRMAFLTISFSMPIVLHGSIPNRSIT